MSKALLQKSEVEQLTDLLGGLRLDDQTTAELRNAINAYNERKEEYSEARRLYSEAQKAGQKQRYKDLNKKRNAAQDAMAAANRNLARFKPMLDTGEIQMPRGLEPPTPLRGPARQDLPRRQFGDFDAPAPRAEPTLEQRMEALQGSGSRERERERERERVAEDRRLERERAEKDSNAARRQNDERDLQIYSRSIAKYANPDAVYANGNEIADAINQVQNDTKSALYYAARIDEYDDVMARRRGGAMRAKKGAQSATNDLSAEAMRVLTEKRDEFAAKQLRALDAKSDLKALEDVLEAEQLENDVNDAAQDLREELAREQDANSEDSFFSDDNSDIIEQENVEREIEKVEDEAEETMDIEVLFPVDARFPIEDDSRGGGRSVEDFLNFTFGTDEESQKRWQLLSDGEDIGFLLNDIGLDSIQWVVEKLFGPILKHWASSNAENLGQTSNSLWTAYWTDSIVPFATAFAIELHKRVVAVNDADSAINDAYVYFRDMVEFVISKALAGVETADGVPENTQREHLRARSLFDDVKEFRENLSIRATLGVAGSRKTTKNQLLSLDNPLRTAGKQRIAEFARKPSDPANARGRVSSPLIKMIFLLQEEFDKTNVLYYYSESNKRLFEVDLDENNSADLQPVKFYDLRTDTPPARQGKKLLQQLNEPSLQSIESIISRIFGLPILDALYIEELLDFGINSDAQLLQDVGGGLDLNYVSKLGVLPSMFANDSVEFADGESLREPADEEDDKPVQVETKSITMVAFDGTTTATMNQIDAIRAIPTNEQRFYPFNSLSETPSDDQLERARLLLWPALLNQLANIDNLWTPSSTQQKVLRAQRPTRARFVGAHRVVGALMFAQVALNPADVAVRADKNEDLSFFGRIVARPSFEPADENAPLEYLKTAAAPSLKSDPTKTVESEAFNLATIRRVTGVRKGLNTLDKAIVSDKDKREIGGFIRLIRNNDAVREILADAGADITVLVPTDEALEGLPKGANVLNVVLFHVIDETPNFKAMRNDRKASRLPTLLLSAQGEPSLMQLRVERYDTDRGGTLSVIGRAGERVKVGTSELRLAKNGNYVIVDEVLDYQALGSESGPFASPTQPSAPGDLPEPFAGSYQSLPDDVGTNYVGMPESEYGALELKQAGAQPRLEAMHAAGRVKALSLHSASQARQSKRNTLEFAVFHHLMRVSGADAALRNARAEGHHVAVLAPTSGALARAGLDPKQLVKKSNAELAALPGLGEFCKRHVVEGNYTLDEQPDKPLRAPLMPQDFMHMMGNAQPSPLRTLASDTKLAVVPHKTRLSAQTAKHARQGLHFGDLDLARSPAHTYPGDDQVYVHFVKRVLAPAPRLSKPSAAAPTTTTKSAMDAKDFATKMRAIAARKDDDDDKSSSESSSESEKNDDDSSSSSSSGSGKERQSPTKESGAAPKRTTPLAAPKRTTPLAPRKITSKKAAAAAPVVRKSTTTASVASAWREAVTSTAAELRKSKHSAASAYPDVARKLSARIDAIGGAKSVASAVDANEVGSAFGKLRQAVARNQNVKIGIKAEAHDALEKIATQFA